MGRAEQFDLRARVAIHPANQVKSELPGDFYRWGRRSTNPYTDM